MAEWTNVAYLINCLVPAHQPMLLHPASGVARISCEEGHETKRK